MKRPFGVYFAAVGLYLTAIFHVGPISVFIGRGAAHLLIPKEREIVIVGPAFLTGMFLLIVLIVGVITCRPLAVRIAGFVFAAGVLFTIGYLGIGAYRGFPIQLGHDRETIAVLLTGLALSLLGATYLLRPSFINRCREFRAQRKT